jgi:hypothetical protein
VAVTVRIEPASEVEWWRPLVQGLLCVPHLLYTGLLSVLALVCVAGIGLSVLLTGRVPPALGRLVVLPHVLVLGPIGFLMDALYPVWMVFAAAGRGWSPAAESLLLRVEHWVAAVIRYAAMLDDERPRFGLAAYDGSPVPSAADGLAVAG